MTAPRLQGLHHVKLPVSDLDTSLSWYQRVFDAQYLSQFDHYDRAGCRYAVILRLPGVDIPIELRWAPRAAAATIGYDPVHFVAGDTDDLLAWMKHLDGLGIEHSPAHHARGRHRRDQDEPRRRRTRGTVDCA